MEARDILAIIFGVVALVGVLGGAVNRFQLKKGIGAQFIRYIAIVVALPVAASLAFQGLLTEAAVSVLTGALGYAFAQAAKDEKQ
jgi:hypothetical protein